MTHDECSELLLPLSQDELAGDERARVEAHLRECEECSEELDGLRALLAPAGGGLNELERRRLHAGVAAQIAPSSLARTATAGERAVRWFGAAALLVLLAVGVATVGSDLFDGSGGGDEAAESGNVLESDEGAGEARPESASDTFAGPTPVFGEVGDSDLGLQDGPEETESDRVEAEIAGGEGRAEIFEFVPGKFLRRFAEAYSGADATALQVDFINQLADQAPAENRSDVQACARQAAESQPYPLLPTYATIDARARRPMLVLVFVWSDQGSSALDRYQVWRWPLGNCDTPPRYEAGVIPER